MQEGHDSGRLVARVHDVWWHVWLDMQEGHDWQVGSTCALREVARVVGHAGGLSTLAGWQHVCKRCGG